LSYPWITQEENLQHRTRLLDDYEPQSAWWPFASQCRQILHPTDAIMPSLHSLGMSRL
jgi:hypothetical protein